MSFYGVKVGRKTGIFRDWNKCKEQVNKFPDSVYKKFSTFEEANKFIQVEIKTIDEINEELNTIYNEEHNIDL